MIEHARSSSHIPHDLTRAELKALDGAVVVLSRRRVLRLIDPVQNPHGGVDVEMLLISGDDRVTLDSTA